ncbi:coproporphyrinogen III oxidase [Elstera litoralis]|uniref:Coproporphyrinogen-III oxidase n=1 Tax=Elstera litoralis TaxID=552518 RepID=A0A0F3IUZ2_9PROT|nr:coproporphyrinogen III oxidase [Elstera litoralis]
MLAPAPTPLLTADQIARFEGRVPRYTSYPTAPHFTPTVTGATYGGWLEALPDGQAVSLYLHIPFCQELCWYCGCHTQIVSHDGPIRAYAELLLREIDLVAARLGRAAPVHEIHFGGGSPSMLPLEVLEAVMDRLHARFNLTNIAEIAMEIDPRGVRQEQIQGFAALGLTRASIGVQDFDAEVQALINRRQSFAETADVVEGLRAAGIGSINLDLIYGLPAQTRATIQQTVDLSLALAPDRIALFGYAHVPWMKKHQALIPEDRLPSPAERYTLYQDASDQIAAAGYERIGLDHFARPSDSMARMLRQGSLRRNFQGYTTDGAETLIGFGTSSIGALPQGYLQNNLTVPDYRAALMENRLPIARGIALSADDKLRRAVIERLMCDLTVDLAAVAAEFGSDESFFAERLALADLTHDGLVAVNGSIVTVREAARPLVRSVAAAFDAYLSVGAGRYSQAV